LSPIKPRTKRQLKLAVTLTVSFAAIWLLWTTPLVYPLKIFVVLLHEISHAAATLATGGRVTLITLDPLEGGATFALGGNVFVMLSAGYLGSLLWGLLLIRLARARAPRVRIALGALGLLLLGVTVAVVRGWFGLLFGLIFGFALILAARKLSPPIQSGALTILGITSTMYALLDIRSDVLDRPGLPSDAFMLAELTGVPTAVWGFLWIALGLVACGLALRSEFRRA
jgi:hypothetical protein